jgi:hypothetical protein
MADTDWQHPWLRGERLIRSILETRWDNATWPTAKATLKRALEEPQR